VELRRKKKSTSICELSIHFLQFIKDKKSNEQFLQIHNTNSIQVNYKLTKEPAMPHSDEHIHVFIVQRQSALISTISILHTL